MFSAEQTGNGLSHWSASASGHRLRRVAFRTSAVSHPKVTGRLVSRGACARQRDRMPFGGRLGAHCRQRNPTLPDHGSSLLLGPSPRGPGRWRSRLLRWISPFTARRMNSPVRALGNGTAAQMKVPCYAALHRHRGKHAAVSSAASVAPSACTAAAVFDRKKTGRSQRRAVPSRLLKARSLVLARDGCEY